MRRHLAAWITVGDGVHDGRVEAEETDGAAIVGVQTTDGVRLRRVHARLRAAVAAVPGTDGGVEHLSPAKAVVADSVREKFESVSVDTAVGQAGRNDDWSVVWVTAPRKSDRSGSIDTTVAASDVVRAFAGRFAAVATVPSAKEVVVGVVVANSITQAWGAFDRADVGVAAVGEADRDVGGGETALLSVRGHASRCTAVTTIPVAAGGVVVGVVAGVAVAVAERGLILDDARRVGRRGLVSGVEAAQEANDGAAITVEAAADAAAHAGLGAAIAAIPVA
mmetsp:Transcript_13461/g.19499  ORF Transcript_13461/g.19499 Transcript_13461/m.19499 type:complete len:279 (-) Transcript_13461:99-935(-)